KTTTSANIRQRYWWVSGMHKLDALTRILEVEPFDAMIIFSRTKAATEELAEKLQARGLAAAAINGDMQQAQRERTIGMLKEGKLDILVATDVAARGLDVERISHVLNYDIPYDTESYVHRIGRTGRAGRTGDAILFATPREKGMLRAIERATRQPIEEMQLPSVDAVNDTRISKFMSRISDALDAGGTEFYRDLLQRLEGEKNVPAIDIAAALAKLLQGDSPFLLTPPVRGAREERAPHQRNERSNDRGERPARFEPRFERGPRREDDRGPRPPRPEGDFGNSEGGFERAPRRDIAPRGAAEPGMETFRIEVGHVHGVKPGNIVGAIANEAGLESRFIGRIDIHDDFSVLDLPAEMPQDLLTHLKKVWVSGQQLQMRKVEPGEDLTPSPRPAFKPKFGQGKPRGPGGPRSGPGGNDRPPRRDGFKPRGPRNF
ncbi:MAG: helicase-related protein, partial [Stenotrophomonas maltophilia]